MTFEEAEKILKKEGFHMYLVKGAVNQTGAMREFEKPEVCEAIKVANANRWAVALFPAEWDEREALLKKEYGKNSKAYGSAGNSIRGDLSGNKSIGHFGEPVPGFPLGAAEGIKSKWKDIRNTGENPALEESASQFNGALLDEQARKIAELTVENGRLKDQFAVTYACRESNGKYSLKQIRRLGREISRLNSIIHDKNAVLSDVAEELRLSKIREKNLTGVCQKYMKENGELKEHLKESGESAMKYAGLLSDAYDELRELKKNHADRFIGEVNANTLKGAPAYKEKVIAGKGGDRSAVIAQCCKNIAISEDEAEIIERCTKNGTELHYSEKDGFTYTNMFGDEMPVICLRGMYQVFTDEEIKNMKK